MATKTATSDSWEKHGTVDDSEEKIQYAFRIISEAHRGKAMTSDAEIRSLRQTVEELKGANGNLAKKLAQSEREIMEQQHRMVVLGKDNENLSLANRQLIQRVEKYKRIQQTFSEALENSGQEEEPMNFSVPASLSEYRSASSFTALPPMGVTANPVSLPSPKNAAPTAERTSGGKPTPLDSAGGKDGKLFFKAVRSRLSYEMFNSFLGIIKKLNSHEFNRETAVEEARKLFGAENADLIPDFQVLINRHNFQK